MAPSGFDVEGLVVPAYAVFALTVGVLAGLLLRRTVAAMTRDPGRRSSRPGWSCCGSCVRLHGAAPPDGAADGGRPRTSATGCSATRSSTAVGRQISAAREDLAILHAQQANIDPHTYLVTLGWKRIISYQPAGRFWTFQIFEAGLFVALSARSVALTRLARAADADMTIELDRADLLRLGLSGGRLDAARPAASPASAFPAAASRMALRVRQPRADESVLRAGAIRQRGRGHAARRHGPNGRGRRGATSARW